MGEFMAENGGKQRFRERRAPGVPHGRDRAAGALLFSRLNLTDLLQRGHAFYIINISSIYDKRGFHFKI
jgi:hypothetical protein